MPEINRFALRNHWFSSIRYVPLLAKWRHHKLSVSLRCIYLSLVYIPIVWLHWLSCITHPCSSGLAILRNCGGLRYILNKNVISISYDELDDLIHILTIDWCNLGVKNIRRWTQFCYPTKKKNGDDVTAFSADNLMTSRFASNLVVESTFLYSIHPGCNHVVQCYWRTTIGLFLFNNSGKLKFWIKNVFSENAKILI